MPSALVFTLQPTATADLHRSLGRTTHAAVLDLLGMSDPALPTSLHEAVAVRPLTVSNLMDRQGGQSLTRVTTNERYRLRVTLLRDDLERIGAGWCIRPPSYLALGEVAWRVLGVTADGGLDPWAGQDSYAELAARALHGRDTGPGRWHFEFTTPVSFRRQGASVPLPTPGLVFGSLLDKWNALAGFPLPEELRARLDDELLISDFNLRSAAVPGKGGSVHIGALGSCTYQARRELTAYRSALDMLAHFAFYSGVGAATARGLGQVRLIVDGPARDARRPAEVRNGAAT